jgi:hypothetical protein
VHHEGGQGAILGVSALNLDGGCGQIVIHGSVAATNSEFIVIEADSGCTLRVDGSITSRRGGERVQLRDISIGGSVTIRDSGGAAYTVERSSIGGSLRLRNNVANVNRVEGNSIGGSVTFSNNLSLVAPNILQANTIGGSVTFSNNRSLVDLGNTVQHNAIDNSLACSGNDPPPIGGGNTVGGSKSGQCATL